MKRIPPSRYTTPNLGLFESEVSDPILSILNHVNHLLWTSPGACECPESNHLVPVWTRADSPSQLFHTLCRTVVRYVAAAEPRLSNLRVQHLPGLSREQRISLRGCVASASADLEMIVSLVHERQLKIVDYTVVTTTRRS